MEPKWSPNGRPKWSSNGARGGQTLAFWTRVQQHNFCAPFWVPKWTPKWPLFATWALFWSVFSAPVFWTDLELNCWRFWGQIYVNFEVLFRCFRGPPANLLKRDFRAPRGSKFMSFPMVFEVVFAYDFKLAFGRHFGSNGAIFWDPLGAMGR